MEKETGVGHRKQDPAEKSHKNTQERSQEDVRHGAEAWRVTSVQT